MKTTFICSMILSMLISKHTDKESVADTVEELRKAMEAADGKKLMTLTSSSLSYGHSNGVLENQIEFIASLTSGKYRFLSIELSDQAVDIMGGLAVVRHRLFAHTADAGKPRATVDLHVLTVWKKVDGCWILVARQAVKLGV